MDNINFFSFKLPDATAEGLQIMQFHCSYAVCSLPAEILCKVPGFNFGERSLLFHRKASLILALFRIRFDFLMELLIHLRKSDPVLSSLGASLWTYTASAFCFSRLYIYVYRHICIRR